MIGLPNERGQTEPSPLALRYRSRRRLERWLDTLLDWYDRRQQRCRLLQLDDHMLKDIGLSRADAVREAGTWWLDVRDLWRNGR